MAVRDAVVGVGRDVEGAEVIGKVGVVFDAREQISAQLSGGETEEEQEKGEK